MGPFPRLINPECCYATRPAASVHLHFLCYLVGFHFVIFDRYNAPSFVMAHARAMLEVMLGVDDLKGR